MLLVVGMEAQRRAARAPVVLLLPGGLARANAFEMGERNLHMLARTDA